MNDNRASEVCACIVAVANTGMGRYRGDHAICLLLTGNPGRLLLLPGEKFADEPPPLIKK